MFDHRSKIAFVLTCLILAGGRGAFDVIQRMMGAYLHKDSVSLRQDFSRISREIGDWRAKEADQIFDEAVVETLGTPSYLYRTYTRPESIPGRIDVHVAYYTGMIDPVPHVPDRCFVAAGLNAKTLPENLPTPLIESEWREYDDRVNLATGQPYRYITTRHSFTGEQMDVTMPIGTLRLRTTLFEDTRRPQYRIFAGYFFLANGRTTPTPDRVRLMAFDLSERFAYYCKVQLTVVAPSTYQQGQFVNLVAEFLDDFLPELMRCLPDWSEVERIDAASSNS